MSAPATPQAELGAWYGRPRVMVPLLLGLAVLAALLTPERANRSVGEGNLTTRETTPGAASLAAELPRALGWTVDQNVSAVVPPRTDMVHLVLAPPAAMRASEVHALLERVRAGAGLYVIINKERDALADSLHLGPGISGTLPDLGAGNLPCPAQRTPRLSWLQNSAHYRALRWTAPAPGVVDTLLQLAVPDEAETTVAQQTAMHTALVMGFPLGRGRVVASADADLLRNDELRQCEVGLGVLYLKELEYLRDSSAVTPRRWLLFDEYHQGFGPQPGTVRAVVTFFSETSAGHVLAQLALAGLLVLLMRAPRIVPPLPDATDERRSPIEHVDALARAYVQVGASKTATHRLLRGLRRRLERGAVRGVTSLADDAYLDRVSARTPSLAAPVGLVRRALVQTIPARDFTAVGEALATIEQTLRHESR